MYPSLNANNLPLKVSLKHDGIDSKNIEQGRKYKILRWPQGLGQESSEKPTSYVPFTVARSL